MILHVIATFFFTRGGRLRAQPAWKAPTLPTHPILLEGLHFVQQALLMHAAATPKHTTYDKSNRQTSYARGRNSRKIDISGPNKWGNVGERRVSGDHLRHSSIVRRPLPKRWGRCSYTTVCKMYTTFHTTFSPHGPPACHGNTAALNATHKRWDLSVVSVGVPVTRGGGSGHLQVPRATLSWVCSGGCKSKMM